MATVWDSDDDPSAYDPQTPVDGVAFDSDEEDDWGDDADPVPARLWAQPTRKSNSSVGSFDATQYEAATSQSRASAVAKQANSGIKPLPAIESVVTNTRRSVEAAVAGTPLDTTRVVDMGSAVGVPVPVELKASICFRLADVEPGDAVLVASNVYADGEPCLPRIIATLPESDVVLAEWDPAKHPAVSKYRCQISVPITTDVLAVTDRLKVTCTFKEHPKRAMLMKAERVVPPPFTRLNVGDTMTGSVKGESMVYFQVRNPDPTRVLCVRVEAVNGADGEPIGDPDLFMTNCGQGIGPLNREQYTWKSTHIGADRIDVHPSDTNVQANGHTYLIGVWGCKRQNQFTLTISSFIPPTIRAIWPHNADTASTPTRVAAGTIMPGETHYFSFRPDNLLRGHLFLRVAGPDCSSTGIKTMVHAQLNASRTFGGVIAAELMSEVGTAEAKSKFAEENPSAATMVPVIHVSNTCLYPDEADHCWKAAPPFSPAELIIDLHEFHEPYTCNMSVTAAPFLGTTVVPMDYSIEMWQTLETEALTEQQQKAYKLFHQVFDDVNAGSVSHNERARLGRAPDSAFTYGEVEFPAFLALLLLAKAQAGENFYDLGCGSGKALAIAALTIPFKKAVGIELLPGLADLAEQTVNRLQETKDEDAVAAAARIQIIRGSFISDSWADADVVYASSICFGDDLMDEIGRKAINMKSGARFITLKGFPSSAFDEYFDEMYIGWHKMSWGTTSVTILRRK